MEHKKEGKVDPVKDKNYVDISLGKLFSNGWFVVSLILVVILAVSLYFNFKGGIGVKVVDGNEAAQKAVDFINSNPAINGKVSLVSVTKDKSGQFYEATVEYMGQQIPIYLTLDGKYLLNGAPVSLDQDLTKQTQNTNTNNQQKKQEIPKTDKPKVELFVMSHCPFGTQIEKGMLPVAMLLKDKIDFEIKFVYYIMHGEKEVYEQLNQYCIQKEQKAKYFDYLKCFLTDGDSEKCLTEAKIDKTKLKKCTDAADKEFKITENLKNKGSWLSGQFPLFEIHKADNEKYGVAGSPTLVINGVEAQTNRDSASLLKAICDAFRNPPAECSTELESASPSPGFGWDKASSNNLATCG